VLRTTLKPKLRERLRPRHTAPDQVFLMILRRAMVTCLLSGMVLVATEVVAQDTAEHLRDIESR
jgi:hypothetical protein